MTNKSGGAVSFGAVVILDNTNASGFTTTTSAALATRGIGVVLEPNGIANDATGMVAIGGWVPQINLDGAATIGQFVTTSTTGGQGTAHDAPQVTGDFATALAASATPDAMLFGSANAPTGAAVVETVGITVDGAGSAVSTGVKGYVQVPYACTITANRMFADQSGSCVIDVWKDTYANFPPDNSDSITASAPPTLSGAQKSEDATLTGWTTSISAGDILGFNVDSAATVERVTLQLIVTRS